MTKSRLRDLKEQIKEMSQDEIEHEKPDEIAISLKRFLNLIIKIKTKKDKD